MRGSGIPVPDFSDAFSPERDPSLSVPYSRKTGDNMFPDISIPLQGVSERAWGNTMVHYLQGGVSERIF
jgi:hypothetical protein